MTEDNSYFTQHMEHLMRAMRQVEAHTQKEEDKFLEIIPAHIDRGEASQSTFDHAKKQLKKIYGGKRCIVCESRGENWQDIPGNLIESHHMFEWSHWNNNNIQMVEIALRALSPFMHGLYMIDKKDILAGKPIPSLWEHPDFIGKPFTSLDDARNQFFLCHSHHQQATHDQIAAGLDALGIHHVPFTIWIQYMGTPHGVLPATHISSVAHVLDPVVD